MVHRAATGMVSTLPSPMLNTRRTDTTRRNFLDLAAHTELCAFASPRGQPQGQAPFAIEFLESVFIAFADSLDRGRAVDLSQPFVARKA